MAETRSSSILFRPSVHPHARHAIAEELAHALGEFGDMTGDTSSHDPRVSEITLDVNDVESALRIIRAVLRRLKVRGSPVIVVHEPEQVEHRVYE
jgi:hypothetical protein